MTDTQETTAITQQQQGTELAKPERPILPKITILPEEDGSFTLRVGESDDEEDYAALRQAMGLTKGRTLRGLLSQVANSVATFRGPVEDNLNFAIGFIRDLEPKGEVEAALAAQMAAVHIASMAQISASMNAASFEFSQYAERAANRLMRTFASQMEALRKLRNGGEQKVTVEHVNVHEGGQAIVGAVAARGVGDV